MKKYKYRILVFVSALFFLASCSRSDEDSSIDGPEGKSYPVTYAVSIFSDNDPNASDDEMMKTIHLIVVGSGNVIEKIERIDLPSTQEVYESKFDLTTGSKTIYGFANLTNAMMTACLRVVLCQT